MFLQHFHSIFSASTGEAPHDDTKSMLPSASPAPPWLLTPVSVNFRTMAFAYFMGCPLSLPIAMVMIGFNLRPFAPPQWTWLYYLCAVAGSCFILPFWCGIALRDQPILRQLGFRAFMLFLLLVVFLIALFPTIQSAID